MKYALKLHVLHGCCRVPEQDDGVQPGDAEPRRVAAAARRAAHHRLQPPLVLRRPRPLG